MIRELVGNMSGQIELLTTGATARREFIGEWGEMMTFAMNMMGQPHPELSALRVKRVQLSPEGPVVADTSGNRTECRRASVEYSFEFARPKLGDPPRVSYQSVSEALATGHGRKWADCSEQIEAEDFSTAVPYTAIRMVVDMAVSADPTDTLQSICNKVNHAEWQGAPAESVLFEEFNVDGEYDWETQQWYYRVRYSFLWRDHSHNEVWRGPIPRRRNGAILYYQSVDASDTDTYTTDATKVDHPVPKGGTAGAAGWTKTTPLLYQPADFSKIMGF